MKGFLLALIAVTLTACHSPGQAQAARTSQTEETQTRPTQTRATQTQMTQTQAAPTRTRTPAGASGTDPASGLDWIAVSGLPPQGQQTHRLILSGGPFPYARDGVAFQNREGVLPRRSRGTYREYTVRTPGSSDRGARRIVCAESVQQRVPECYYTGDHYASFRRIRP